MADQRVKPGVAGIWLGILVALLGMGSCAGGVAWGVGPFLTSINDVVNHPSSRVKVPTEGQDYHFEKNAAGLVMGIGPTVADVKRIKVKLTGPKGTVALTDASTYSNAGEVNGEQYRLISGFRHQPAGTYTLSATGPSGTAVAIVSGDYNVAKLRVQYGVLLGFLLFLIGTILAIVTGVRRRSSRRALAAADGPPGVPPPLTSPGTQPPMGMQPPPGGVPPGYPISPPMPPGASPYPTSPPAAPSYPPVPPAPPAPAPPDTWEHQPPPPPPPPPPPQSAPPPPPQSAPPPPPPAG